MDPIEVHRRHPTWGECSVCGRFFASGGAFDAHMTSTTSRTCRDPATVRKGSKGDRRLVPIITDGIEVWRWQTGDRPPPAFRTPPSRPGSRP
jgi:hypothetical protein